MCSTTSSIHPSYTTNAFLSGVRSFGISVEYAFCATTKKIKDAVTSPVGQGVIGFGLGAGMHKIYGPLTEKIVLGAAIILPDPFSGLGLGSKILLTPLICVLGPILEEIMFRGVLQEILKDELKSFYVNRGFSDSGANTASRVTSVFFSSVIFGLIHFANAIVFWCNPVLFLPQVVATTIMGLIFGFAKEFSGELHMPFGMHIGNNTLAWAQFIKASF
jgi:membrane protease YdiL (CAAX protease family)